MAADLSMISIIPASTFEIEFKALTFPNKIWKLVTDSWTDAIRWNEIGDGIIIDSANFQREVLDNPNQPLFKTTCLASVLRQLNLYGFRKTRIRSRVTPLSSSRTNDMFPTEEDSKDTSSVLEFRHPHFHRNRVEELGRVCRRPCKVRRGGRKLRKLTDTGSNRARTKTKGSAYPMTGTTAVTCSISASTTCAVRSPVFTTIHSPPVATGTEEKSMPRRPPRFVADVQAWLSSGPTELEKLRPSLLRHQRRPAAAQLLSTTATNHKPARATWFQPTSRDSTWSGSAVRIPSCTVRQCRMPGKLECSSIPMASSSVTSKRASHRGRTTPTTTTTSSDSWPASITPTPCPVHLA